MNENAAHPDATSSTPASHTPVDCALGRSTGHGSMDTVGGADAGVTGGTAIHQVGESNEDSAFGAVEVGGFGRAVVKEVQAFGDDLKSDMKDFQQLTSGESDDQEDVFDLLGSSLFLSVCAYLIADLRAVVRKHQNEIEGDEELIHKFMELPIVGVEVMKLVTENESLIAFLRESHDSSLYMSAVEKYGRVSQQRSKLLAALSPDNRESSGRPKKRRDSIIYQPVSTSEPVEIVVFDDFNSNKELVYMIVVDRAKRQLKVAFRGSATTSDWAMNARMALTSIRNPLENAASATISQRKWIGLHSGFHQYLFGIRNKESTSKYDQILVHLRSLLETHAEFSIVTSGHSLGGALATLFSFQLSLEENIKKPVLCVSFASPKPGNVQFSRAFQELELQNKIVCLRVANQGDIIPQLPDRLTCCTFFYQNFIFRQVGIEMRLYGEPSNRTHRFIYPRIHRSRARQLLNDWKSSFLHVPAPLRILCGACREDYAALHSCSEYIDRLSRAQDRAGSLSVQNVFHDYKMDVSETSGEFLPTVPKRKSGHLSSSSPS